MRSPLHLAIVLLLGGSVLAAAVTLTALGEVRGHAALQAGRPVPQVLAGPLGPAGPEGLHVILYSTDCAWCLRQAAALGELGITRRPIVVVNLAGEGHGEPVLPPLPPWIRIVHVRRAVVERTTGPLATPTHLLLDARGQIVLVAKGFRTAARLRAMDAVEVP